MVSIAAYRRGRFGSLRATCQLEGGKGAISFQRISGKPCQSESETPLVSLQPDTWHSCP